ncbi:hypothetical protein ACFFX0_17855 [Citricoccus parietis]|uniref:Uncharacterized protein n=1 Tax=Citricoccus parietis TaxID=592307 RepID=A0ABV5G201_9MICC
MHALRPGRNADSSRHLPPSQSFRMPADRLNVSGMSRWQCRDQDLITEWPALRFG